MRRYSIKYIFAAIALIVAGSSCVKELPSGDVPSAYADGDKIMVDFSVTLPEDSEPKTKALTENPTINSLHLVVFDAEGYLVEYAEAKKKDVEVNGQTGSRAYTVELTISSAKRIIHFIANSLEIPRYGTEIESIGAMTTADAWDVYWQRVELPGGITVTDSGALSPETLAGLSDIGLVRNFAKLTMSCTAESFEPISFFFAKERTLGSVAPYNISTGEYIENYQDYESLSALQNIGYDGYIPANASLDNSIPSAAEFDSKATAFGPSTNNYEAFKYLYERETPLSFDEQPFIIVKGMYLGRGPYYYKISLSKADGKSFPILRNFNYGITIKQVSREGSDSPLRAANSSGSGDISTSMDPTLINISDGSSRLFVSYTDTLLVSNNSITFRYRFIPNVGEGSSANGILADRTSTNPGVYFDVIDANGNVLVQDDMKGSVITGYSVKGTDDRDGYRTVTLNIKDPGAITSTQYLRVYGHKIGETGVDENLYRNVSFKLMNKKPLIVRCNPDRIERVKGTPIDIQVGVPAGLSQAQFPMDIMIEAESLSLTPDGDNLPVETGTAITDTGKTTFWYIRTVTWDEYSAAANETVGSDSYKFFSSHFKSNIARSDSEVYAKNKYFDMGNDSFVTYIPSSFEPASALGVFDAGRDGGSITLKFTYPSLPEHPGVTIYIDAGAIPAEGEDLTQSGTVTIDGVRYGKYIYYPDDTGEQTIQLETTTANTGLVNIKLESYEYHPLSLTAKSRLWFYFGDDMYTGAATNGMILNTASSIIWYVHYEDRTENTADQLRTNYKSYVTIGGQRYDGYVPNNNFLVTIDGESYVRYVSTHTNGTSEQAVFQGSTLGTFQADFEARHKDGTQTADSRNLIVREPIIDARLLDEDFYSTATSTITVWATCEGLSYAQHPSSVQVEGAWVNANKTDVTKVIDGITYYAYTAQWIPPTYQNTWDLTAVLQYPQSATTVRSNTQTVTFNKQVAPISASDLAFKGIKGTQNIVVTGANGRTLSYTVADPTIATVSNNGVVTPRKGGVTTITITAAENGTYYAASTTITVTVSKIWIIVQNSDQYTTTRVNDNGTNRDIVLSGTQTTLTWYVHDEDDVPAYNRYTNCNLTSSVVINGATVTGTLTTTTSGWLITTYTPTKFTIDGETYYKFTANYTPTTGGNLTMEYRASDSTSGESGTLDSTLPVWTFEHRCYVDKDHPVTTTAGLSASKVVLVNSQYTTRYLSLNGTSNNSALITTTTFTATTDAAMWWQISATGRTIKGLGANNMYINRSNNNSVRQGSATNWTFNYNNGGWTIMSNNRYMNQTANTTISMATNTNNANTKWYIYPIVDMDVYTAP